jgi:AcrR family transcriptional regulator
MERQGDPKHRGGCVDPKQGQASAPPKQGRPRGSYAKSATTKAAILDAALAVFAEGGYRAGSLREVAARVGISETGLLHHFKSKSRLLELVLERRDELAAQFVPRTSTDGIETMHGLIALAKFNASEPGAVELYCTLSAEATSPSHPAHAYFTKRYESTRAALVHAFSDLRDQELMADGVGPDAAARSTIAMMDGLQVQWLFDRSALDMAVELRDHLMRITRLKL